VNFTVKQGEFHDEKANFTIKGGESFHVENVPFHSTVSRHFQVNFHHALDKNLTKESMGFVPSIFIKGHF
jgi:hypothetical protein